MNKHKYLSLAVSAALAASLCACSESSGNTAETDSSVSETSLSVTETTAEITAERIVPPMDTSPLTLSLYIDDPENAYTFDTLVSSEITARTGVTLEIIRPEGDISLDVLTASDELPDLIYAGERTSELIESGLIIPLDDYVQSVGENFPALYGENLDTLRYDDGKLYTFGTGGASSADFTAEGTFQIQYAVLEELGYPEITTLEQLGDCLKQYLENHPECTGLLLCGAPHQQWLDTVSARVNYVLGYPDDGEFLVDNETGEAVYKWIDPRTGEFVKWLNTMYNDGVLDEDSFSLKHDAYIDKIAKGKVLAIADCYEDYSSAEEKLASAAKYDKMYCPLAVAADSGTQVAFLADYGDFTAAQGIGITSSCEEPERAFRFLDWWCSDEAQELICFGTDDINAEFDPASDSYSKDTGVGIYAEPFPMKTVTEKNADGEYYYSAVSEHVSGYTKPQAAAAEAYGITLFAELFPQREDLPEIKRTLISEMEIHGVSEEAILLETLESYIKTEVNNAITVPAEEFDAKWQEITEWCSQNGAERLSELMTEYVQTDMGM